MAFHEDKADLAYQLIRKRSPIASARRKQTWMTRYGAVWMLISSSTPRTRMQLTKATFRTMTVGFCRPRKRGLKTTFMNTSHHEDGSTTKWWCMSAGYLNATWSRVQYRTSLICLDWGCTSFCVCLNGDFRLSHKQEQRWELQAIHWLHYSKLHTGCPPTTFKIACLTRPFNFPSLKANSDYLRCIQTLG